MELVFCRECWVIYPINRVFQDSGGVGGLFRGRPDEELCFCLVRDSGEASGDGLGVEESNRSFGRSEI